MFSRSSVKCRQRYCHLWRQHHARMAMAAVSTAGASEWPAGASGWVGRHQGPASTIKAPVGPAALLQRLRNPAGYAWVMRMLSAVVRDSDRRTDLGLVPNRDGRTKSVLAPAMRSVAIDGVSWRHMASPVRSASACEADSVTLRDVTVLLQQACSSTPKPPFGDRQVVDPLESVRAHGGLTEPAMSLHGQPLQSPFEGPSSGQPECLAEVFSTNLPKEGENR